MRNHYFYLDCFFGMDEPSLDSAYSDALETLLAGQDFVPGNPLAIEYYHVTSFDTKRGNTSNALALSFFSISRKSMKTVKSSLLPNGRTRPPMSFPSIWNRPHTAISSMSIGARGISIHNSLPPTVFRSSDSCSSITFPPPITAMFKSNPKRCCNISGGYRIFGSCIPLGNVFEKKITFFQKKSFLRLQITPSWQ